jgi:hypothetical protein
VPALATTNSSSTGIPRRSKIGRLTSGVTHGAEVIFACAKAAVCYNARMATKTEQNSRRTTLVPVTTMEEVPVLTAEERAELIDSLEAAETRIEAGDFVEYDPETFKDRLLDIHRNAKRANHV